MTTRAGTILLVIAIVAARVPAAAGADASIDEVRQILAAASTKPSQLAGAVDALDALGPSVVEPLFIALRDGLDGGVPEGEEPDYERLELQDRVILEALQSLREPHVLRFLDGIVVEGRPEDRSTALGILAEFAEPDDLVLAALLAGDDGSEEDGRVRARFEIAAIEILEHDDAGFRALSRDWDELAPWLRAPVVRLAGVVGGARAFEFLEDVLSERGAPTREVLAQLRRLLAQDAGHADDFTILRLRPFLRDDAPEVRAEAAGCFGVLEDFEASELLMELLEDDVPGVREAANAALTVLSGLQFTPGNIERWRVWFAEEQEWFADRRAGDFEALESDDVAVVCQAISSLARHRLLREETVAAVQDALDHPSLEVRSLACAALECLGSKTCAPVLVRRLDDSDDVVRRSAYAALRALTGRDLPLDADTWRDALSPRDQD